MTPDISDRLQIALQYKLGITLDSRHIILHTKPSGNYFKFNLYELLINALKQINLQVLFMARDAYIMM